MLWLEWRLATLALLTLPLYWLTTSQLTRRIREASRKQRLAEGEMASAAAESLAAVKDLQALSLEPVFAEQFTNRSQKCQTQNVVTARLSASLDGASDVSHFATALVLFFGVRMALNDQFSPPATC